MEKKENGYVLMMIINLISLINCLIVFLTLLIYFIKEKQDRIKYILYNVLKNIFYLFYKTFIF